MVLEYRVIYIILQPFELYFELTCLNRFIVYVVDAWRSCRQVVIEMASQCTDCGSTEVERDEQQGQVYCTGCGRVLQNYILLAQQQFQETSAGGITAVGQHVGEG